MSFGIFYEPKRPCRVKRNGLSFFFFTGTEDTHRTFMHNVAMLGLQSFLLLHGCWPTAGGLIVIQSHIWVLLTCAF